jgi:hypothetical protein
MVTSAQILAYSGDPHPLRWRNESVRLWRLLGGLASGHCRAVRRQSIDSAAHQPPFRRRERRRRPRKPDLGVRARKKRARPWVSKPGLLDRIERSQEQIARKWGLALNHDIVTWAAVEDVETGPAEKHVVAGAAEESVVALAADQNIGTVAAVRGE